MNKRDCTRVEVFRQLRDEIRGSEEYLVVGIDVAKARHTAFFGTATGKSLFRRLVFQNDREGFERLLIEVEAIKVRHGLKKVVFGLEPTGNYHKPLGEYLIKAGHQVVLVSGKSVKRNRELLDGRWDKHDMKDSANVADLISQGKCLYYEYPEMKLRELRALLALKRRLKRQEQALKVRIRNHLLAQYFPEFDRYFSRSETESLAIVRWCLAPSVIAGLEYEEFVRLVAPRNRGMRQQYRLRAIWQKASVSIGCEVSEGVKFEAKVMVEGLRQIREPLGDTEARIEQVCLGFPEYPYLLTIPGFGPDVSSKVLGAIGDPFRFKKANQVLKTAGLDLSANRSGNRCDGVVPVISKNGKSDLRYALYQAAMIASTRNREFIVWFTNKLRGREREKGIQTKMRVKLSAKLLIIAWTLMKKKEPFNPDYLNIE
jgi:transposase